MKTIKTFPIVILVGIMVMTLTTSCATLISGQKQLVSFSTEPPGAKVTIIGKKESVLLGITPLTTKIKRRTHSVKFQKEGYREYEYFFKREFNWVYMGNCLLGGLPGMIVDMIVGSYIQIDDSIYKELEKK